MQRMRKRDDGISHIPFVSSDGEPMFCLKKEMRNSSKIPIDTILLLKYNTSSVLKVDSKNVPSVYFAIHDARRNVNPFKEGRRFEFGYIYTIDVKEVIQQTLLPAPYDTNCTDYLRIWEENNNEGPLTHTECIEYCELKELEEIGHCIPITIGLSHTEELCEKGQRIPKEIMNFCSSKCGEACFESIFRYEYRVDKTKIDESTIKDIYSGNLKSEKISDFLRKDYQSYFNFYYENLNQIYFNILLRNVQLTTITFDSKAMSIDLFSNIGGFLGIWIGLSLVSVLDLLRRIIYLFYDYAKHKINTIIKRIKKGLRRK